MRSMLQQRQEALGQLRAVLRKERMAALQQLQESLQKVRDGVGAWGVGGLVPETLWVTLYVGTAGEWGRLSGELSPAGAGSPRSPEGATDPSQSTAGCRDVCVGPSLATPS